MKENREKVKRLQKGEKQGARRNTCPIGTMLITKPALAALGLNAALRSAEPDLRHDPESSKCVTPLRIMKSLHRVHDKKDNDR